MDNKINELSEEKKIAIVNAAIEVFAMNDYKRASTDLIASKAGISKGLLFYYFHNKKELYLYIADYCMEITKKGVDSNKLASIKDFFEILEYGTEVKMKIIEKNPYITDFILRAYYSEREEVSEDIQKYNKEQNDKAFNAYFAGIDKNRFKPDVDIKELYNMLLWMSDGYISEKRRNYEKLSVDDMMTKFRRWVEMFRKLVYKEEFQK